MKCALCGYEFEPEKLQKPHQVCKGSLLCGRCKLISCPNCGYKTPPVPDTLKKIFGKDK